MLLAFGANAICPYVAFSTVRDLAESGMLEEAATPDEAMDSYITAVKKGLLKTFSRMGISTIRSFCGSQIFEAVGLGPEVIGKYFTLHRLARRRHRPGGNRRRGARAPREGVPEQRLSAAAAARSRRRVLRPRRRREAPVVAEGDLQPSAGGAR